MKHQGFASVSKAVILPQYKCFDQITGLQVPVWGSEFITEFSGNVLTDGGRDFFHTQCYTANGTGSTQGGNYIAVSSNTGGASTAHTSLAGEINNTNGLGRALATTRTHTNGTNTSTLAKTWTATGTETATQLSGLFTASSSGTLTHEATYTSTTVNNTDTLTLTWTLTLG